MEASRPPQSLLLRVQVSDVVHGDGGVTETSAIGPGSGIAMGDWNQLFNAVKMRLIRTVTVPDTRKESPSDQGAARIRTCVLECVEALDQLHATITAEWVSRETLELEVLDAKASLAQIRAALLGK